MMEDIMDYNVTPGTYRQQPPLRPPPNLPPPSVHAAVSPRFDSLMARSSSVPWSPAPMDGTQSDKPYSDPLLVSQTFTKSVDIWPSNNQTNGNNSFSNEYPKNSEPWKNNSTLFKTNDMYMNGTGAQNKPSERWSPTYANSQNKPSEPWSSDMFTKPEDSSMTINNSSNAHMIKNSNKTFGRITDRCSPRCKLGMLGFIIGFLAVGIAVAVVLVLWLRQ